MEFLVVILVLALAAAVVVALLQRRRPGARPLKAPRRSPIGRPHRTTSTHPLADAVVDHMHATDPADIVVAEQRMKAEARQVAAGMQGGTAVNGQVAGYADNDAALQAASADPSLQEHFDPVTGEEVDGYDADKDPRYQDSRYDGRLAADWVDPRDDPDRAR